MQAVYQINKKLPNGIKLVVMVALLEQIAVQVNLHSVAHFYPSGTHP
jgi:hypothetical protein